jgi:asparagine synthase (glutamine-hydrolysing)
MAATLGRMTDVMRRRGPDDSGVFVSDHGAVGLGHTRLSIIDPSAAGHQPMSNETGRIWITYNGEIYNFPELRDELENRGHVFKSRTDTEVLIHGYEQWGIEDLLTRLRGMFSFAVCDLRGTPPHPGRLLVARDRLGQKPLYYTYANGVFIFASEIRAILASKMVEPEVDPSAIGSYLSFGHIPPPETIYRGISALRPGHYLVVDQGGPAERSYYDLSKAYREGRLRDMPGSEAVDRVHACLLDTLKCHLISDVPVGVFLSGGIDSSSIVAGMRRIKHDSIRTVSIAFPDTACDESPYARQIAATYATDHVEVMVSSTDLRDHVERILGAMDQPTVDGVNTYFVALAAARTGLKVALSGVGGDEIFWGYPSFTQIPRLRRLHRALSYLPMGRPLAGKLLNSHGWSRTAKLASILSGGGSVFDIYRSYRRLFPADQIRNLLDPDLAGRVMEKNDIGAYSPGHLPGETIPGQVGFLETTRYLPNQLLRDTDTFSMAHSLEVRSPFVDHILVELLARIPDRLKAGGPAPKPLLIKSLKNGLPHTVVHRRKQGFVFPFGTWLRNGLRGFTETTLATAPHLNRPYVHSLLRGFLAGRVHWSRVWSLMVLNHWLKQTP